MHRPVLVNEVLDLLNVLEGNMYVDATVGSGGHAAAILQRMKGNGRLLGIDRDIEAIKRAQVNLEPWQCQCVLAHGNFVDMVDIAYRNGIQEVNGIIVDLGVSSEQLETAERGFSFARNGPLDMRMDKSQQTTAADLVNALPEQELVFLLKMCGEERDARRIARAVAREREKEPIVTTAHLATIVARAKGWRRGRLHPATKTFMALRMAVNEELKNLEEMLGEALKLLGAGGRLAIISFQSHEDRTVKTFFYRHSGRSGFSESGNGTADERSPELRLVTRKAVTPSEEEMRTNPRSRSAKLRVAEKQAG